MIRTELITLGFRKRRPLGITYSYRFQHTQSEQQPKDFWNNVYRAANSSTAKILYAVTGGAWVAMYIYRLYSDNRFTDIVTRDMRTLPRRSVEGESKFQFIIMGGGPGGCTTAYCLSKWLEEMNLPGKVLLIDAGPDLTQSDLRLESWEREWGAKSTVFEQHIVDPITGEQTLHPVFPSEHRGLGGGSAHNTAIPMCLDPEERHRYTLQTGCTRELFDACHQAAILLEPITPASASNPWWESFIETVTNGVDLRRVPQNFLNIAGDENTIGYFAVAGWPRNDRKKKRNLLDYKALRFTSALLVQKTPKHQIPSRLTVLSNTAVQRVAFRGIDMQGLPIAGGVVVKEQNGCTEQESLIELDERGELICALGALSGPSVMQWSGIGDPKVLKKANIPCILPNRHVGAHGHDHTETSVVYEVGGKLHSHADSSLSVMGWDVGVFRRLPKSNAVIQCHASFGGFPYTQSEDDKVLVTTPNLTEPESEFCIQVRTADPKDCFDILHEPFTKKDREVLVESVRDIIHLWEPAQRAGLIGKRISPCPDKSPEEIQFEDLHIETPFHWHNTMSRGKAIAASDGKLLNEYGQRVSNIRVVGASAIRARRNLHIPIMGNAVYVSLASFEEYARRIGQHSVVREPNLIKIARREVAKKSQDQNFTWKKPGEEIDSMHEVALELQNIFEAQKA